MARETTTRGRSELARHDARRWTCITRLRPTWRGVSVAVVAATLVVVEIVTGDTALLLVLVVVAVPFVVAPVMVLGRAQRGEGVEVHLMIAPPVVPVGAPSRLLVQLTPFGCCRRPSVEPRSTVGALARRNPERAACGRTPSSAVHAGPGGRAPDPLGPADAR